MDVDTIDKLTSQCMSYFWLLLFICFLNDWNNLKSIYVISITLKLFMSQV